jgi:hypothetical protein
MINTNHTDLKNSLFISNNKESISGYYISGLTQSDGSFFCGITKTNSKTNSKKAPLRFKPIFTIVVDLDSKETLIKVQEFLGCGAIAEKESDHSANFTVTKIEDLKTKIVPHFQKYPVYFEKLHALNLLVKILDAFSTKGRDRDPLLVSMLQCAVSMNDASRRTDTEIKELYNLLGVTDKDIPAKINYTSKEDISPTTPLDSDSASDYKPPIVDPGFFIGLIDGDGSFNLVFTKTGLVIPTFSFAFSPHSMKLLPIIQKYVGVNGVLERYTNVCVYRNRNLDDLKNLVIPFMDSYCLHTEKRDHYKIWKEVCVKYIFPYHQPVRRRVAMNKEDFLKVIELSYNMNKNGKRRKLTKEEYINSIVQKQSSPIL